MGIPVSFGAGEITGNLREALEERLRACSISGVGDRRIAIE
jgi:hypothetical protein